jgi:hypothetical protein
VPLAYLGLTASVFAVHDVPLDRGFRRSLLAEWLPLAAALTD